jgi:hypothetical protein
MAPRRFRVPYQGVLARPIEYESFSKAGRQSLAAKVDALCAYYGIQPESINRDLLVVLARRYVPGFQVGKFREPKQKRWDDIQLARLWLLYRQSRLRFGSDKEAIAHLHALKATQRLTGAIMLVWLGQLIDKAKRSPLVQLLESGNPSDKEFARKFLDAHAGRRSPDARS